MGTLMVVCGCIAVAVVAYLLGVDHGRASAIDAKIPDELRECGDKRNPHQWGEWSVWGSLREGFKWASADDFRDIGIVQERVCKRCKYKELDESQVIEEERA